MPEAPAHDDVDDPELAALLHLWLRGWSASRDLPAPVADGPGWRVEVGQPGQRRRHVMPTAGACLSALGERIVEPDVYLKACCTVAALRALLPPRWTVQAPRFFMVFDEAAFPELALPAGYTLECEPGPGRHEVAHVRVRTRAGAPAADGRVVLMEGHAIFDRIGTDEAHRRRGLGGAVMSALHAEAARRGASRGLLAATQAGQALYATLGWRVRAPYASAVIEA